ncbi:hypothetical protein ACFLW4_05480 [Chloroflexota bacterium]
MQRTQKAIMMKKTPSLVTKIEGGMPSDIATMAGVINSIPRVLHEKPGLLHPINMNLI